MTNIEKKESLFIKMKYSLYLATHPMDGFWDLKHAGKGSLQAALVIVALFFLSVLVSRQLTAWQFNENYTDYLNIFQEFFTKVGPYALWCIATWCVTSLMDGQGTMKDIVKATSYSFMPLLISNFIVTIVSNIIVGREAMFYVIIKNIGFYWTLGLIFLSVIAIHQYTVSKAVLVTILSIVGMIIIVVLGILMFYLIQQLIGFGLDVFKEYTLRVAE